jgi:crotonobetaine/carnitine-CoA ligase
VIKDARLKDEEEERVVVTTKQAHAVAQSATVDGVFRERLAAEPDAEFVKCGSRWLTFAQLDDRTDRLAAGLASLGVGRGTMIATILPNRIETVEILLAVAKLGAVQVPLNYWLKGEFLAYQLDDCGASMLMADDPGYAAAKDLLGATGITRCVLVDDILAGAPDDVTRYADLFGVRGTFEPASGASDLVSVMYTSGTTAEAKGCMLSSGYYVSVVDIRAALPVNALSRVMKHVLRDEGVTGAMWDLDKLGLVATRKP